MPVDNIRLNEITRLLRTYQHENVEHLNSKLDVAEYVVDKIVARHHKYYNSDCSRRELVTEVLKQLLLI